MLVKGEVKCLHCGFISGRWVGMKGSPLLLSGFTPREPRETTPADALVRCARCDGPVYLEDVEPVVTGHRLRRIRRMRAQLASLDPRRDAA
jgi:hypothetical protein